MTMENKDFKKLLTEIKGKKELSFINNLHADFPKATVFLVGGATRDIVAGISKSETLNSKKILNSKFKIQNTIPAEDLDFVVEGIDKKELEKFLNTQGRVKDVESRAFGVFKFVPKQQTVTSKQLPADSQKPLAKLKADSRKLEAEPLDISIPRSDKWIGEGYKDIEIKTQGLKLYDDLSRRDFTINAMAINLRTAELIDKFEGQKDLQDRTIRAVGKPEERFKEDPSRILRGIRFAVQLGFKIEKKTIKAMKKIAGEIRKPLKIKTGIRNSKSETNSKFQILNAKFRVSEEVVAKEFLKSLDKGAKKTIILYDEIGLLPILFPEIEAMKGVEQPKNFHSEGDVYKHTLISLEKLKQARPVISQKPIKHSINLKLACLFHDIGKPETFTPPAFKNDRIHFNEHDEIGAKIAKRIIKRLKLSSMPKDSKLHVDKEIVDFLVRKHMILITAKPDEMKLSTFEKYFFREDDAGDELLMLSWADISATIPPSGNPDFSVYDAYVCKIEEIRRVMKARKTERTLSAPLVNGHEVMRALNIKSGPEVGAVLARAREMQLRGVIKTKEEAIKAIKALKE